MAVWRDLLRDVYDDSWFSVRLEEAVSVRVEGAWPLELVVFTERAEQRTVLELPDELPDGDLAAYLGGVNSLDAQCRAAALRWRQSR